MRIPSFFSRKPKVYRLRYEREDGHFREIDVPTGRGLFRKGSKKEAREIAESRLEEMFGPRVRTVVENGVERTVQDVPPQHKGHSRPDLLQSNYSFVSMERV